MSEYVSFIMVYIFRVLLLLLSFVVYVFLMSCIYPKVFLKPYWNVEHKEDRGLKKYRYHNGRAIVYEPSLKMRKYIKQYILSVNDDRKYIKCKLDDRIYSIVYDIIAYSADDKIIDDILVTDFIQHRGYSSAAELPHKTSYVHIIVREVNGIKVGGRKVAIYSSGKVLTFFVAAIITTVLEYMAVRRELLIAAKLISLKLSENGTISAISISLILGIVSSMLVFLSNYSGAVKISKKISKK